MPIPDYQTLMLPVLRLAVEGEQKVADVVDRIADEFSLGTEERQTMLASGRQRVLHNRIHWAKFYMTKAGFSRLRDVGASRRPRPDEMFSRQGRAGSMSHCS